MEVIKIIHELRGTSSRNKKKKILKKYEHSDIWRKYLSYVYNPYVSYYNSPHNRPDFDRTQLDVKFFEILDDMANEKIRGKEGKQLAKILSKEYGEAGRLVLARTVKANLGIKTINSVYEGLIPEFDTMKGKDIPFTTDFFPCVGSIKYDGVKLFITNSLSETIIQTSSGLKIQFDSLKDVFKGRFPGMYEGELIHDKGMSKDRPVITGKLNTLINGDATDIEEYSFMVYDRLDLTDWFTKQSKGTFYWRHEELKSILKKIAAPKVRLVEQMPITGKRAAFEYYEHLAERGYEGAMYRKNGIYLFTGEKRTKLLIKKKAIKECTLLCTDVIPHTNPTVGVIGSLICEGRVDGHFVRVNLGSGLSKFERNLQPDHFINKRVEALYNTITHTDKTASLFLARYKRVVGGL